MLTIDFESRSEIDIRKTGHWAYAEDPSTDILGMAWKVDDAPAQIWIPQWVLDLLPENHGLPVSDMSFLEHIKAGAIVEAHNAGFERAMWERVAYTRYNWPLIAPEQWRCSAAKAAAFALPRSLEQAGEALGLPIQKDKEGHRLMLKLCKPRKARKAERDADPDWENKVYWHEKPEEFIRLFQYCLTDVESEHCLSQALRDLSGSEQRLWHLDQAINARGMYVDIPAAEAAVRMIERHEAALLAEMKALTNGMVQSPRQIDKTKQWLKTRGVDMPDLTKAVVAEVLKNG